MDASGQVLDILHEAMKHILFFPLGASPSIFWVLLVKWLILKVYEYLLRRHLEPSGFRWYLRFQSSYHLRFWRLANGTKVFPARLLPLVSLHFFRLTKSLLHERGQSHRSLHRRGRRGLSWDWCDRVQAFDRVETPKRKKRAILYSYTYYHWVWVKT